MAEKGGALRNPSLAALFAPAGRGRFAELARQDGDRSIQDSPDVGDPQSAVLPEEVPASARVHAAGVMGIAESAGAPGISGRATEMQELFVLPEGRPLASFVPQPQARLHAYVTPPGAAAGHDDLCSPPRVYAQAEAIGPRYPTRGSNMASALEGESASQLTIGSSLSGLSSAASPDTPPPPLQASSRPTTLASARVSRSRRRSRSGREGALFPERRSSRRRSTRSGVSGLDGKGVGGSSQQSPPGLSYQTRRRRRVVGSQSQGADEPSSFRLRYSPSQSQSQGGVSVPLVSMEQLEWIGEEAGDAPLALGGAVSTIIGAEESEVGTTLEPVADNVGSSRGYVGMRVSTARDRSRQRRISFAVASASGSPLPVSSLSSQGGRSQEREDPKASLVFSPRLTTSEVAAAVAEELPRRISAGSEASVGKGAAGSWTPVGSPRSSETREFFVRSPVVVDRGDIGGLPSLPKSVDGHIPEQADELGRLEVDRVEVAESDHNVPDRLLPTVASEEASSRTRPISVGAAVVDGAVPGRARRSPDFETASHVQRWSLRRSKPAATSENGEDVVAGRDFLDVCAAVSMFHRYGGLKQVEDALLGESDSETSGPPGEEPEMTPSQKLIEQVSDAAALHRRLLGSSQDSGWLSSMGDGHVNSVNSEGSRQGRGSNVYTSAVEKAASSVGKSTSSVLVAFAREPGMGEFVRESEDSEQEDDDDEAREENLVDPVEYDLLREHGSSGMVERALLGGDDSDSSVSDSECALRLFSSLGSASQVHDFLLGRNFMASSDSRISLFSASTRRVSREFMAEGGSEELSEAPSEFELLSPTKRLRARRRGSAGAGMLEELAHEARSRPEMRVSPRSASPSATDTRRVFGSPDYGRLRSPKVVTRPLGSGRGDSFRSANPALMEDAGLFQRLAFMFTGEAPETPSQSSLPGLTREEIYDAIVTRGGLFLYDFPACLENYYATSANVGVGAGASRSRTAKRMLVLLCYNHRRTLKYLLALASGTLILSVEWLVQCLAKKRICPVKSFVVPAGVSYETGSVVMLKLRYGAGESPLSPYGRLAILASTVVQLVGSAKFLSEVEWIIRLAGGVVAEDATTWEDSASGPSPSGGRTAGLVRVVVVEPDVDVTLDGPGRQPEDLLEQRRTLVSQRIEKPMSSRSWAGAKCGARTEQIPCVSLEWVIQCLVNQRRLPVDRYLCRLRPRVAWPSL